MSTRLCPALPAHNGVSWWLRDGAEGWKAFVKHVGLKEALACREQAERGFRDDAGNWWCGACYQRAQFMNWGKRLGYHNLYEIYAVPKTRDCVGYEAWFELACKGGLTPFIIVTELEKRAKREKTF